MFITVFFIKFLKVFIIIVLADTTHYKKAVFVAPAFFRIKEVMLCFLNSYKCKIIHSLVHAIWKQAAKEKFLHKNELNFFEKIWDQNSNEIISIHRENDQLVSFKNSEKLAVQFPKCQFNLIQIRRGNHGVIWNRYDFVSEQLILCLK